MSEIGNVYEGKSSMSIRAELENALKQAMREHDEPRKRVVRMALAGIKQVEVDKGAAPDEAGVIAILQKEIKSRQEAEADAQKAGRADLIEQMRMEARMLEGFLPQQLSPQELDELARQAVAETGAATAREMGQVMKVLMPRIQGRATGDQVSQAVRRLLNQS
jgi:uncharacterized protein YqeY